MPPAGSFGAMSRRLLRRHSSGGYAHLLDGGDSSTDEGEERCCVSPIDQLEGSGSDAYGPITRARVRRAPSFDGAKDKVDTLRTRIAGFVRHL